MSLTSRLLAAFALAALARPVLSQSATSPIHRDAWIVAGSGSFGRVSEDGASSDRTYISVAPTALKFVTDHLAFGGSAVLGYSSVESSSAHTVGVGPAVRYYFADPEQRIYPYLSAAVMPTWQNGSATFVVSGTENTQTYSTNTLTLDGAAGMTGVIAPHVGLSGELFYTRQRLSGDNVFPPGSHHQISQYGFRLGFTIFLH